MAAENRETVHSLIRDLQEHPTRYAFFRAVWLLERSQPGAVKVGGVGPAGRETLRLRPSASMAFPAADVDRIEEREAPRSGPRYRLTSPILGIYGVTSPLPSFYTEDILHTERTGEEDDVRGFFDVINHRLMSLLYRAWAKYRWEYTYERGGTDALSRQLMSWLGLGVPTLRERVRLPEGRLLRYAGTLSQRPRNAGAVAGVLSDWFDGIRVRLEQCIPRWVSIPEPDRCRLGIGNSKLGDDVTIGRTILDRSGKCRIEIGPLDYDRFQELRSGGSQHVVLCELARLLLPDALDFDFRLILERAAVPSTLLEAEGEGSQLGGSSWLLSGPAEDDKPELFAPAA